jgi:hypothetical protein
VSDGNGRLFVETEKKLRPRVAEMVDERIVETAKARAGIDRDIVDAKRSQRFRDGIAAELGDAAVLNIRPLDAPCIAQPGWHPGQSAAVLVLTQASILPRSTSLYSERHLHFGSFGKTTL